MDRKKIIIIISSVIAIILMLLLGWYLFFRTSPTQEPAGEFPTGTFPEGGGSGGGSGIPGGYLPSGGGLPNGAAGGLYQLVGSAVSGSKFKISTTTITSFATTTETEIATTTSVRYFDKSTGNLFEIKIDGSETNRLSNSTILRAFDVFWSPDAEKFVVEYAEPNTSGADTVKFFSAQLATSSLSLDGEFLPTSVFSVISSPYEEKLFYLAQTANGTVGLVSDFSVETKKQVFSFDFNEFNLSWPGKNTIALNTKPSSRIDGFLYSVNPQTGSFSRILGDIRGLTTLISPNGEWVLYSQSESRSLRTKTKSLKTNTEASIDQQTLPEKCAWSTRESSVVYCAVPKKLPSQYYPDAWYQGAVSFEDTIWKINLASSTAEMIVETDLDAINMQIDPENKYIIFTNKKDLSLWALKLVEQNTETPPTN